MDIVELNVIMQKIADEHMPAANYLKLLSPVHRWESYLDVLCDRKQGGLNATVYAELKAEFETLGPFGLSPIGAHSLTQSFGLVDITRAQWLAMEQEVRRVAEEKAERCWHPDAGQSCDLDASGRPEIIEAHSIQKSRILKAIAGSSPKLLGYHPLLGAQEVGEHFPKNASTFRGMCRKHDAVFTPIEAGTGPFHGTQEHAFLYALRAFLYFSHNKEVHSHFSFFDHTPWREDIAATKAIYDEAYRNGDWGAVEYWQWVLPKRYPLAASGCYCLEYDFDGTPIPHSLGRMEYVYITAFPEASQTIIQFAYLKRDAALLGRLGAQLVRRNSMAKDISILLAHTEDLFFEPAYFRSHIQPQLPNIVSLLHDVQRFRPKDTDVDGRVTEEVSLTPPHYLSNPYDIQLFHD